MLPNWRSFPLALALSLALAAPAPAQDATAPAAASEDQLRIDDPIIVIGENGYPPLWRASRDGNEMYIFGLIDEVPKNTQWRTDQIEPIIQRADIILPGAATFTSNIGLFNLLRLASNLGEFQDLLDKIQKNDNNQDLKTVVDPLEYGRFIAIMGLTKAKPKEVEKLRPAFAAATVNTALREAILEKTVSPSRALDALYAKHKKKVQSTTVVIPKKEFMAATREIRKDPPAPAARELHLACFREALKEMETNASSWGARPQAWANGDVERLRNIRHAGSRNQSCWDVVRVTVEDTPFNKYLEEARQKHEDTLFWAAAKHKTGFVAMGVDRILEKDGILDQFRDRGYQVEFVTPPEKSS